MQKFVAGFAAAAICSVAILISNAPAIAGTVTLKSMQFSAAKPVPHFHYEGEVVAGDLERIAVAIGQQVVCDPAQLPQTGGNCAVVTLRSEGGNYIEGLSLAQFFRSAAIATWVESGSYCYSACAFAFLGGSGHSSWQTIGDYIDRTLEPGATLGFHAPYVAAESLSDLIAQIGIDEVLGGTRDSIALMIEQLVRWNVDKSVLALIANMGADESFTATNAQDLYLLRTALPDAPRHLWSNDPAEALRNACMRLLAHHEEVWPYDAKQRLLAADMTYGIGNNQGGQSLSGYRLVNNPSGLAISYCATTDAHLGSDADISLFSGPGIEGYMRPALTFFHRPSGWSALSTSGAAAAQRIFQKGTIGHFFLPPDMELGGSLALTWRVIGQDFLKPGRQ